MQLVIDDEIIQIIRRIGKRFEINDGRIGIDVVNRVGPKGSFLADDDTYNYFRDEIQFYPAVFDFSSYSNWINNPKGIYARAEDKVIDVLKQHEVPPLEDAVTRELEKIVKAADREIV